jgi:putative ABC transport system substrate-binding protein
VAAFHRALAEAGYVEGRNLAVAYRWAEGRSGRIFALAADLVRQRVAVIVVNGTPGAIAAKAASPTIPIIFLIGVDPVEVGLVASFNRPGGNATGLTSISASLGAKRVEMLHELLPGATSMALLINPSNSAVFEVEVKEVQVAAQIHRVPLLILYATNRAEIETAIANAVRQRVGGLLVSSDAFFAAQRELLVALAAQHALPAIYAYREAAQSGGLMSYGTDNLDSYRLLGVYTGRILKGEKPADLPVQQATKVELTINLKTAKALGITVPLMLRGRADEVVE